MPDWFHVSTSRFQYVVHAARSGRAWHGLLEAECAAAHDEHARLRPPVAPDLGGDVDDISGCDIGAILIRDGETELPLELPCGRRERPRIVDVDDKPARPDVLHERRAGESGGREHRDERQARDALADGHGFTGGGCAKMVRPRCDAAVARALYSTAARAGA